MKKILSLALAVLMLLSLTFMFASCGDKDETPTLVCGVTIFEKMNERMLTATGPALSPSSLWRLVRSSV